MYVTRGIGPIAVTCTTTIMPHAHGDIYSLLLNIEWPFLGLNVLELPSAMIDNAEHFRSFLSSP